MPNDPATSDIVTERTVCWLPSDAVAFGNKPEWKNVWPVPRTTQTYYTPTLGRSQCARHSTPVSQEEINQTCALILEAEREACAVEIEVILERERKEAEEHSMFCGRGVRLSYCLVWATTRHFPSLLAYPPACHRWCTSPACEIVYGYYIILFVNPFFFFFFLIICRCCGSGRYGSRPWCCPYGSDNNC
jgi:hypothetical protein